jgi:hypothetical protein
MRGVAKDGVQRIRGGVIWAELGPEELDAFLEECARQRRTSGFLGGRIIADWLKGKTTKEVNSNRITQRRSGSPRIRQPDLDS